MAQYPEFREQLATNFELIRPQVVGLLSLITGHKDVAIQQFRLGFGADADVWTLPGNDKYAIQTAHDARFDPNRIEAMGRAYWAASGSRRLQQGFAISPELEVTATHLISGTALDKLTPVQLSRLEDKAIVSIFEAIDDAARRDIALDVFHWNWIVSNPSTVTAIDYEFESDEPVLDRVTAIEQIVHSFFSRPDPRLPPPTPEELRYMSDAWTARLDFTQRITSVAKTFWPESDARRIVQKVEHETRWVAPTAAAEIGLDCFG